MFRAYLKKGNHATLEVCFIRLINRRRFFTLSPGLSAEPITGGVTTVALNAATVGALVGIGFGIAPIAPSTLTGLDATFPILKEGDLTAGLIYHSGGLVFTKGGTTTDIGSFIINLVTDKVTGSVNNSATDTTPFFDIGAGDVLSLDPTLASALVSIYGVPNLSGATIGVATVDVTLAPRGSG